MIRVIGFTGKKGHGKSTASNKAKELLEGQGLTVVRVNFKDALTSTMIDKCMPILMDISRHYNETVPWLFENKPPIMRHLMQQIGTDIYRSMDSNYWVDQWKAKVEGMKDDVVVICDDVRFINEFEAVKSVRGTVNRIVATNKPKVDDEHQSEKEQDSFLCTDIVANSKEELEDLIIKLLPTL